MTTTGAPGEGLPRASPAAKATGQVQAAARLATSALAGGAGTMTGNITIQMKSQETVSSGR